MTGNVVAGTSLTVNVTAAVARPGDFTNATVVAQVVDNAGILLPNAQLVQDSASQYHAVLQTAPSLAPNNYKGSFSVRLCRDSTCASQFPGSPVALPYDITVQPAGSASFTAVPAMPLNATSQSGGATPASVPVAITSGGSWSASSGAAWLKLSAASGSGNATLTVSYDATGLAAGSYSTQLSVTSGGATVTLTATLTVLPPSLVLGSNSVTFTAINGAPVASQIVSLNTENKVSTAWTAGSNNAWLSVSPTSGTTPATTVLTVDPTIGKLASGSYNGSVTLKATGLADRTLPVTLNLTPATLATSVTTMTLGGTYGRDFSSAQVAQQLKLSLNTASNSWTWTFNNVPLWASASTSGGTINAAGTAATRIKLIRPNGVGMLALSDGQLYLTANSSRLANLPLSGGTLAASADGKRVVQQTEGAATIQHTTVSVDYAALAGGTLFAAQLANASHGSPGTQGQDLWVNADGTRVIYAANSAAGTPKSCTIMDGASLGILGYLGSGNATPNNVAVLLDGRIVCAGAAAGNSNDIYLYDSTGTRLIQQYKLNSGKSLLPRQLAASGDGWILAGITSDGTLTFLPIGP